MTQNMNNQNINNSNSNSDTYNDTYWMQKALFLAYKAFEKDEVPVGAIIVKDNKIIGTGFNQPISLNDSTAHAEILAIRDACNFIKNYRLVNTTMYVTLEPCSMCMGAIIHARIKRLIFGANDEKTGAVGSVLNLTKNYKWNHEVEYTNNVMQNECRTILQDFFKSKRSK